MPTHLIQLLLPAWRPLLLCVLLCRMTLSLRSDFRCRDDDCDGTGGGPNQGCLTRLSSFDDAMLMVGGAPDFQDVPGDIFGMLLDDASADVPITGTPAAASSAMDAPHNGGGAGRARAETGDQGSFDASVSELFGPGPRAPRQSLSGERLGGALNALERLEHHRCGSLTVLQSAPDGGTSSGACSVGSIGAAVVAPCSMGGLENVYSMSPA